MTALLYGTKINHEIPKCITRTTVADQRIVDEMLLSMSKINLIKQPSV
jgi:hypothetical protein